jgi:hypothetical protein
VLAFLSTPIVTRYSLTIPTPHPSLDSLYGNRIGDKGASALAAILKETQITNLGCAAARVFAFVSTPIDTKSEHVSLSEHTPCVARRTFPHSLANAHVPFTFPST